MELHDLNLYELAREISRESWFIYQQLDWQTKKTMGDQWITAIDSVGANIAEGFGRYHYLDKNKFNYNARGSLLESLHWTELMHEREKIPVDVFRSIHEKLQRLHLQLNTYIKTTREQNEKQHD